MTLLMPIDEGQAAEIISSAAASGQGLRLKGNGTRALRTEDGQSLSSGALTGIVDFDPAEMVMVARAGTPVADVERLLAEAGQMLPFEPMDHRGILGTTGEPTIGGVFAANVSGPRRFVAGAARDCLLGLRYINGTGEVLRAGGRVMKNVTGLDMVKLLAGSRGGLGFLTEVTFRVQPRPETTATLVLAGLGAERAAGLMASAMATSFEVSGAAHLPVNMAPLMPVDLGGGAATLLRLEGRQASVDARVTRLLDHLAPGEARVLDAPESLRIWAAVRDVEPFHQGGGHLWSASLPPANGYRVPEILGQHYRVDGFLDWQGGLVWFGSAADIPVAAIRDAVHAAGGGHVQALRAGRGQPGAPIDIGGSDALLALSGRIKASLDPRGVFVAPAELSQR